MPASFRAETFIDSIGVNIGVNGFNTANGAQSLSTALDYLGIANVRVVASADVVSAVGALGTLAGAGVKFDMLLPSGVAPASTIARLGAFAQVHPGAIMAIEGPNEINNFPISYAGQTGVAAGIAFINAAAADLASYTSLAGVALYDLTGAVRSAALSDDASGYVNIHPYPTDGSQPGMYLLQRAAQHMTAGKGLVITEAGYQTGPTINGWVGVDNTTQAKLTLNLLADATKLGVAQTFLYDIKDYNVAGGSVVGDHLGLFDTSLNPKPVATAIHNLTTILADPGANATSFAAHSLDYAITGLPAAGDSLLLEKSSGLHDLLVWAEPKIWNSTTNSAIAVTPRPVTVSFAGAVDIKVFDPLISPSSIASYSDITQVRLAITDHPLVVEVTGGASLTTVPAATYFAPIWASGDAATSILIGGNGNDRLTAGPGNKLVYGGLGADLLTAGSGADTFVYNSLTDSTVALAGQDLILGFNHARGDRVSLAALDAGFVAGGGVAFQLGGSSFTHHAGELIQVKSAGGYLLEGDSNGTGTADFAIMLQHLATPLVSSDFLF